MRTSDAEIAEALAEAVIDGSAITPDGDHTDLELQRLAFTVWIHEAGRDVERTAALVSARSGVPVTAGDVRGWRDDGNWGREGQLVNQALISSAPELVRGTLARATISAISTLLQAMNAEDSSWSEKIRASVAVLDRGGFPPLIRGELFAGVTVASGPEELTDDELRAQWLAYDHTAPVEPANEIDQRHGRRGMIDSIAASEYRAHTANVPTS